MSDETNTNDMNVNMEIEDEAKRKQREKLKKDAHKMILARQKESYAREYAKLTNRFERALIEHSLAAEYYQFRSFWFHFLPLTIIACATTIIGFLINGSIKSPPTTEGSDGVQEEVVQESFDPLLTGQAANVWSIVVGVLGAISTLLTTIGKYTNYQSHYDMHQSAVKALDKIVLHVDFEHDWFVRKADSDDFLNSAAKKRMNNPDGVEYDDLADMLGADLKSHQASFEAMQNSCSDSAVPTPVIQAFTVLDQIVGNGLGTDKDLIFYYHKLWKEFSDHPLWPLKVPSINVYREYLKWKSQFPGGTTSINSGGMQADTTTNNLLTSYGAVDQQQQVEATEGKFCCEIM